MAGTRFDGCGMVDARRVSLLGGYSSVFRDAVREYQWNMPLTVHEGVLVVTISSVFAFSEVVK